MTNTLLSHDSRFVQILLITRPDLIFNRVDRMHVKLADPFKELYYSGYLEDNWAWKLLREESKIAEKHVRKENLESSMLGKPFRKNVKNCNTGNFKVYELFNEVIKIAKKVSEKATTKYSQVMKIYRSRANNVIKSYLTRISYAATQPVKSEAQKLMDILIEISPLLMIDDEIWKLRSASHVFYNEVKTFMKDMKGEPLTEEMKEYFPKSKRPYSEVGIRVERIGELYFVKIGSKAAALTTTHLKRLSNTIKSFVNLGIASYFLEARLTAMDFISEVNELVQEMVKVSAECTPAGIKGAKGVMVARLDKNQTLDFNQADALLKEFDGKRRELAKMALTGFKPLFKDCYTMINFLNFYKALPHPDQNLYEGIENIKGFKEPNEINPRIIRRFESTVRRTMFKSLTDMGSDVRLTPISPIGERLGEMSVRSNKPTFQMMSESISCWSAVEIQPVRSIMNIATYEIKPSNKASQDVETFDVEELQMAQKYSAGILQDPPQVMRCRTVNDAVTALKGTCRMSAERAIARFERTIRMHEEFEKKSGYKKIEDIPSKELEDFIMSNKDARYIVGTEPKFGEVHKPVTRMFYMAEQELKAMTQRVERFVKQITRAQSGVSITKGYAGRKADVREFCKMACHSDRESKIIFISFDMSEFSKKFPMELVRCYGRVLAEVTGQDWLRRIDLFFRASLVIHNTRGYFESVAGVKGGFEGFLNFVWSSIHAMIMEIALECVGRQGRILTFSDDGLLALVFNQKETNKEISKVVETIKRVYEQHGLVFKLSKTLVSGETWEYLGEICHKGKVLDSWIKEVCNVGVRNPARGLDPIYTVIKAFEGQADAVMAAGGPVSLSYVLKRLYFSLIMKRVMPVFNGRLEEVMAIIPPSCGGMRLTSPYEMMNKTTESNDSEVLADITLLTNADMELGIQTKQALFKMMRGKRFHLGAIVSGSVLGSKFYDTSGMSVISKAVRMINSTLTRKIAPNPMETGEFKELEKILMHCKNVSLRAVSELILTSEAWTAYSESMALVRTNAAMKFITYKAMRKLQSEDTENCKDALEYWAEAVTEEFIQKKTDEEIIQRGILSNLNGISVDKIVESPRTAFKLSRTLSKDYTIKVLINKPKRHGKTFGSADYIEPPLNVARSGTTLRWFTERTSNKRMAAFRTFLDGVAKFLAYSPEMEPVVRAISSVFNIHLPIIALGLFRSAKRRKPERGVAIDVFITLSKAFQSSSEAKRGTLMKDFIDKADRVDATTSVEAAKAMASIDWCARELSTVYKNEEVEGYYLTAERSKFHNLFVNNEMELSKSYIPVPKENLEEMPEDLKQEFQSTVVEYSKIYTEEGEMYQEAAKGKGVAQHRIHLIHRIEIDQLSEYLRSYISSGGRAADKVGRVPRIGYDLMLVLRLSIVETAVSIMNPILRRRIMDDLFSTDDPRIISVSSNDMPRLNVQTSGANWLEYLEKVGEVIKVVENLGIPGALSGQFTGMLRLDQSHLSILKKHLVSQSLFKTKSRIIFTTEKFPTGKMSPKLEVVIKASFTATISHLFALFRAKNWDRYEIKMEYGLTNNYDEILDVLYVGRTLIRRSKHRTIHKPYNPTSMTIMLFKMYALASRIRIAALYTYPDIHDPTKRGRVFIKKKEEEGIDLNSAPTETEMLPIIRYIDIIAAKKIMNAQNPEEAAKMKSKHEDHKNMIFEPLHRDIIGRVHQIVKMSDEHIQYLSFMFRPDVINELRSIQHAFYQVLYAPAMSNVDITSGSIRKLLTRGEFIKPKMSIPYYNVLQYHQGCTADFIRLTRVKESKRKAMVNCIKANALELIEATGLTGYSFEAGGDVDTLDLHGNRVSSKGPILATVGSRMHKKKKAEFLVMAMRTENAEDAISTHTYLTTDKQSCVSMFLNADDDMYYIFGVLRSYDVEMSMQNPHVLIEYDDEKIEPEDVIPAIRLFKDDPFARRFDLNVMDNEGISPGQEMIVSELRSKFVFGESIVNNDQPMLQAAYELCQSEVIKNEGAKIAVYALVRMWVQGLITVTGRAFAKAIRFMADKLDELPKESLPEVLTDIALCISWLKGLRMTRGINLDSESVRRMIEASERVRFVIRIPMVFVPMRSKNPIYVRTTVKKRPMGKMFTDYSSFEFRLKETKEILKIESDSTELLTEKEKKVLSRVFF
ncbi:RNA-dependent RNA polymerase [Beihai sesarmid crab virus 3]|uniref:RNA-dependent RNA polymerase n=1 Tax=Beihai sesarmid crab virus 3 TaxID=1922663 RepID=A0A1L3KLE0_9VIRU|nr:RNA-dependent RNA polymerase [Beihai sesarmid crab virus 3]APG78139.1 RNA-dependent RNA polymerase [Beihai sesarmid crab virus 3]